MYPKIAQLAYMGQMLSAGTASLSTDGGAVMPEGKKIGCITEWAYWGIARHIGLTKTALKK
jgi:hypothetical protein